MLVKKPSACTMALTDIWAHTVWKADSLALDTDADPVLALLVAADKAAVWACMGRRPQWTGHTWDVAFRMSTSDTPSEGWVSTLTASTQLSRTVAPADHTQPPTTPTLLFCQIRSLRLGFLRKDPFPGTTSHLPRIRPECSRRRFARLRESERQRTIETSKWIKFG